MKTNQILSTALLTLKEGVREKLFYGIFFLFFFLLQINLVLAGLSGIEQDKILRDFGLAAIEFSGLIIIIFFLTFSFFRRRQAKILDFFLCRYRRREFVLGDFLGSTLILGSFILLCASVFSVFLLFKNAFNPYIFQAVYFSFLKLAILSSIILFLSILLPSAALCGLFGLGIYIGGSVSGISLSIIRSGDKPMQAAIMQAYRYILPCLDKFEIKLSAAYGQGVSFSYFLLANLYAIAYISIMLFLAALVFENREW